MADFIYDIESYPNVFTVTVLEPPSKIRVFECSARRNDIYLLKFYLRWMATKGHRLVGFNNIGYDYPVMHQVVNSFPSLTGLEYAQIAHNYTRFIFSLNDNTRFKAMVPPDLISPPQVDLFKIHHFDNKARRTSLKALEFALRADSIQDLPFPPNTFLTDEQIDLLIEYNQHDVLCTYDFYLASLPAIHMRDELTKKLHRDMTNHNDTKIGKDYFVMRLEERDSQACFVVSSTRRLPRQTKRNEIALTDVILPYVEFHRPEFQAVLSWLRRQTIKETKGAFTELPRDGMGELAQYCDMSGPKGMVKALNCIVGGFKFVFGTGGIHGSVEARTVTSDDKYAVWDFDVASYYPNLSIANGLYPAHLGEAFCEIYKDVYEQRKQHKKGTPENAMLKLALNGVYGDSNNKYSPFYDPQYTMSITINGQLLLCMLAEKMMAVRGVTLLQINTDGLTVRAPRATESILDNLIQEWEQTTNLQMEKAEYSRMFVRDVNNYIAEYLGGKVKRKGAYEYKVQWHQNHSSLVIPKAVEAYLIHGIPVEMFIHNHEDTYDFFLLAKAPRDSRLELSGQEVQRISRYYVAKQGGELVKVMPPLKGKENERRISIQAEKKVVICNDTTKIDRDNIDYDWYIAEAKKMITPLEEINATSF